MTTTATTPFDSQPLPWKDYSKALLSLLPAAVACWFTVIFLLPKFTEIFQRADYAFADTLRVLINIFVSAVRYALVLGIVSVTLLFLLERYSAGWRRFRGAVLGGCIFVLNTAVFLFLSLLLVYSLMAAAGQPGK